jgi:predicted DNA-binding protein
MPTKQVDAREVRFNEVFALRVPGELVQRLERVARSQYETSSSLTRRFILQGLADLERDEKRD